MSDWFTTPENTPRNKVADNRLVAFVAQNLKPPATLLDIGSGSGANARCLRNEGFTVYTLDASEESRADIREDVGTFFSRRTIQFNCIYDINTLQHVEDPPYEKIYAALKPGGKFFSIHTADDTQLDLTGKGFTRTADILSMRRLLGRGFTRFTVHKAVNWRGDTRVTEWQIEAEK